MNEYIQSHSVGKEKPIHDAIQKVTGDKKYVGDMKFPNMLYAKVLFSPIAHGKIISIDTSKAEQLTGVRAVACYKNTPQKKFNSATRFIEHEIPDTERIFDDTVRFVGDKVAAVAADTIEIAKAAIKLIEVEYEELPIIVDVEEAIKEGAYPIHEGGNIVGKAQVNAGDVDVAFEASDYVFENKYVVPPIHHSAMEPHVAVADWSRDDKLTIYSPSQNTFAFRVILGRIFDLPYSKIRLVSPAIGGAFGGKLEMTLEPIVAILSKMTHRPVRLEYTRKETMLSTRTRHGAVSYIKTGFMKDGTIKAVEFQIYTNTGAYASSALNVTGAMSHKVFKAYQIPDMRFTAQPVYTNTPIAGAMRGYGSPQAYFGLEREINRIANFLKIDTVEIHRKNMVKPDTLDPCFHKSMGNPRPQDCLTKALELFDYQKALEEQKNTAQNQVKIGVGMALGVHGNNCFGAHRDVTTIMIKMNEDGSCMLYTGSHDMGNDCVGMQMQIVAEELGLTIDKVDVVQADTDTCLWHLGDYASRGVFVVGAAALKAAELVKKELLIEASKVMGLPIEEIILSNNEAISKKDVTKRVSVREVMIHCQRDSAREICCSYTHTAKSGPFSYGVHFVKLSVDSKTGAVELLDYVAVQDVGFIINPSMIEGCLAGGIHMGLGYALSEGMQYDEKGNPFTTSLKKHPILTASQMPPLKMAFIAEGEPGGPYGAKSLAECPVVPVAPAVVNAICNALHCEISELPASPARILAAL